MRQCGCSSKHVPLPVSLVLVDVAGEDVWLCPTAAVNLELLLAAWKKNGGEPPGSITKHYGGFVRALAQRQMVC